MNKGTANNSNNNQIAQWEFSFDLSMDKLGIYYNKNRTQSYKEIETFLINNGFDCRSEKQGSCYFTSKGMTFTRADRIIRRMFRALPWMPVCLSKAALARRVDNYDLMQYANSLAKSKKHQKALDDYQNGAKAETGISNSSDKSTEEATLKLGALKPKKKRSKSR